MALGGEIDTNIATLQLSNWELRVLTAANIHFESFFGNPSFLAEI